MPAPAPRPHSGRPPASVSVLSIAVTVLALVACAEDDGPRLYRGGSIVTLDAEARVVEAVGVAEGRIAAVGSEAELAAWVAEHDPEVVDLEGAALLPGFIDAHGHFPGEGITAVYADCNSPPIGPVETIDDLVATLTAEAVEKAEGEWIVGMGYDDSLLAERRHPTRRDLDRASSAHPVGVWHISGHLAVVNSAGLEALGIDAETPDPTGGLIRREADGRTPDGVLEETALEGFQKIAVPSATESLAMLEAASERYLANGVTTAQSGASDPTVIAFLDWAAWLGWVPVRLIVWPTAEAADEILSGELDPPDWDPLRLRIGAVKLIADGSIQGYTGYLSEPYHVPPGDDPSYRGYPRIPRDDLLEQVERYHRAGMQIAVHGNGDASIEDILDAFEAAQAAHPRNDARHIVIHAQMARPDQLDRMAALGVIPSFFSLHTFYWGDRHRTLFMGPERASRMSPARSAQERGIRFTIHADSPVVPMEPLRLVGAAVQRRTRSGFVVGEAERISVLSALRAVTIDAARQHHEEDLKGSIEVGKLADLVVLSHSPLEAGGDLAGIEVIETIVGGVSRYRRP